MLINSPGVFGLPLCVCVCVGGGVHQGTQLSPKVRRPQVHQQCESLQ